MGNISGSDELVTKQDLKDFYQAILPYLGSGSGSSSGGGTTYTAGDGIDIINDIISTKKSSPTDMDEIVDSLPTGDFVTTASGYTPLGTIISYYGETAPKFYLACDGSEYNKADYPELAAHLLSLTNHSQYEVDGDATKFKVPDLRGEFLRGWGTNSHTNQGDGAGVGVHQDGTQFTQLTPSGTANQAQCVFNSDYANQYGQMPVLNKDSSISSSETKSSVYYFQSSNIGESSGGTAYYTSRPTNTSVLWCIAYKDIYIEKEEKLNTQVTVPDSSDSSWTEEDDYYSIDVAVNGILSQDIPFLDVVPNLTTYSDDLDQWAKLIKAESNNGYITLYTTSAFDNPITMAVKVM